MGIIAKLFDRVFGQYRFKVVAIVLMVMLQGKVPFAVSILEIHLDPDGTALDMETVIKAKKDEHLLLTLLNIIMIS